MSRSPDGCNVFVDAGTTNTRVWLLRGDEILARATAGIGVRDTARDGSSTRLRSALHDLISQVCTEAKSAPSCVVAAGMITSSLGLVEVPHLTAPAGVSELSKAVRTYHFPEITHLPIRLVPGIRSGSIHCTVDTIGSADVIRGEEVLCMGLVARGDLKARSTLLNLGSHWKVISLDDACRIASSVTTPSGEMIHSVQTQTILASAVPSQRPDSLDESWIEGGMREQRKSGLARALFCVRLLEQRTESLPEHRLAFLIGAFVSADLDVMMACGTFANDEPVAIVGARAVAEAWKYALRQQSVNATIINECDIEAGLLSGLRLIAALG
jgi:2-dehydro-3-deoxygalactonokinase